MDDEGNLSVDELLALQLHFEMMEQQQQVGEASSTSLTTKPPITRTTTTPPVNTMQAAVDQSLADMGNPSYDATSIAATAQSDNLFLPFLPPPSYSNSQKGKRKKTEVRDPVPMMPSERSEETPSKISTSYMSPRYNHHSHHHHHQQQRAIPRSNNPFQGDSSSPSQAAATPTASPQSKKSKVEGEDQPSQSSTLQNIASANIIEPVIDIVSTNSSQQEEEADSQDSVQFIDHDMQHNSSNHSNNDSKHNDDVVILDDDKDDKHDTIGGRIEVDGNRSEDIAVVAVKKNNTGKQPIKEDIAVVAVKRNNTGKQPMKSQEYYDHDQPVMITSREEADLMFALKLQQEYSSREEADRQFALKLQQDYYHEIDVQVQVREVQTLEEFSGMMSTPQGRALLFVKEVHRFQWSTSGDDCQPLSLDDMVFMAYKLVEKRELWKHRTRSISGDPYPVHLTSAWHRTQERSLESIRQDGLMSSGELVAAGRTNMRVSGSAFGPGIYCANNPLYFAHFGPIALLCIILPGEVKRVTSMGGYHRSRQQHEQDGAQKTDTVVGNKANRAPPPLPFPFVKEGCVREDEIVLSSSDQIMPVLVVKDVTRAEYYEKKLMEIADIYLSEKI